MKLLIPPPIQALLSAIMMCLISRYFTHANFSLNGINIFALIFLIIAAIIIILSMYKFKKIKTTISPLRPNKTSSLVKSGIYEYTRNPMYLGLLLMLFSIALFLKNFISFLIIPLFILFITKNQILPEEEALENIFGEEYKNYKNKVRRWI
ncbi:MAG: isoprenylcysteine carboxyl methyltransferase [Candidatus Marinimicrobia bacterium]|nr:isoprenylcysteine carboxyl methyltransferase [Candidatus Neomarinimicrobiota bacterium]|tara:strand:- start:67 stop:519 length:453 start_codon:yes stop_codon:yes gene_type:complete